MNEPGIERDPARGPSQGRLRGGRGAEPGSPMTLRHAFHVVAMTTLLGGILVVGKTVILPVVIAIMLTYVLVGAAKSLRRLPMMQRMPVWVAYVLALTIFGAALVAISLLAVSNLRAIAATELAYEENILRMFGRIGALFGLEDVPTWEGLRELALARLDLPDLSIQLLQSIASAGGYTILISTYVVFMVAERGPMARKMELILPDLDNRGAAVRIFRRINDQIVTYLFTKTLINIAVGGLSWVLMVLLGIENAVFWAFLIGLFNYIPYVGSIVAVAVVVTYTAFTSGSIQQTVLAVVVLTAAQVYVGNWLEPRVMSRSLNLSPLTVLLALVLWSSLWGLTGAIIAVPMTSVLMMVLAGFAATRPVAILASRDGSLA